MAIVIARQRMTVQNKEGKHEIFPSAGPQFLPDHLLENDNIKAAIQSEWIEIQSTGEEVTADTDVEDKQADPNPQPSGRRKRNS